MTKPTRDESICFLNYDLSFGGTEKVIVSLANHLCSLGRPITIITLSSNNDFQKFLDPKVEIISLEISSMKRFIPRLISLLNVRKFDNFVANVWPLTSLSFVVKIISSKTKLIYIEHCNLSEQFKTRNYFFKFMQSLSIYVLYKFSDLVIAVSQGVKEDLISRGVRKEKIQVIYNPVISPLASSIYDASNFAVSSWLECNGKKLIAVGEMKPQKNFVNLIKAFAYAKEELKQDISLLILGDGAERGMLQEKIIELNLQEKIFLAGWVPDPMPYFKLSDLFALSSDYEGFGVVIVEAMSQGVNVVSTDCKSGPSEILKDGELGYLCKVNDPISLGESIEQALNSPIDAQLLIDRAKEFSEAKIGKLYEEIFI